MFVDGCDMAVVWEAITEMRDSEFLEIHDGCTPHVFHMSKSFYQNSWFSMDRVAGIAKTGRGCGVGRKTCVRGPYKNWFGHAPTPIWFSGLLGRAPEHMLVGLAHGHMLMGLAHRQMLMGSICSWA